MDINSEAERINQLLGSNRPVIRKPVPMTPELDDYTIEQLEEYAGSYGLTIDEAAERWLTRHATTHGYTLKKKG